MLGIIDSHIHFSERKDDALVRFARLNGLRYTLDDLLGAMKRYEVKHGLLLSPPLKQGFLPNEEVFEHCRKSDGMLSPVVTVDPSTTEVRAAVKLAEENRRYVRAFKIRLGYVKAEATSPLFSPIYDYAESNKLPVLFHTGDTVFSNGDLKLSHPLSIDELANKREELPIVLCHFGNPWFDDVAELIYKHPNVYTDMSGLITHIGTYTEKYVDWVARRISEAIYYAGGADKVIFGTDYPVTKHSDALDLVKKLDIDETDKEKILSGNAERVFSL